MKATGIVRRIDALGRIVLPREIRRILHLGEGAPMEIFTDSEGGIILKKYLPMDDMGNFIQKYVETLAQLTGNIVCVTDREHVIAVSGSIKKDIQSKNISSKLEDAINERTVIYSARKNFTSVIPIVSEDKNKYCDMVLYPILCEGDAVGTVIMTSLENKKKMGETEQKLIAAAAGFIGKQMEE